MKFILEIIIMVFFAIVISGTLNLMIPDGLTGNGFVDGAIKVICILITIYLAEWIANKIMKSWKGKNND